MLSLVLFARVCPSTLPNFTQFCQNFPISDKFWQISTKPNIISPLNRCVLSGSFESCRFDSSEMCSIQIPTD